MQPEEQPRFTVESWSPDYGAPLEAMPGEEEGQRGNVDAFVEKLAPDWAPITPAVAPAKTVYFVDGVQRIDARVWMNDTGMSRMGLCVSLAAGLVRCDGAARVEDVLVRRIALGPAALGTIDCGQGMEYRGLPVAGQTAADLETALRRRREDLEVEVAHRAPSCDLMIVDGHVRQRETIHGAVGFLKTHQVAYLDPTQNRVVGQLGPGQRTPIFLLETPWSRYSWYLRLPGGQGHDWAGIVRCEASSSDFAEARHLADLTAATLPRFASDPYKDPRAPQNLYPVGSLERELRRHLGDAIWQLRALQRAARPRPRA